MEVVSLVEDVGLGVVVVLIVVKRVLKWVKIKQLKRRINERHDKTSNRNDTDTPKS